MVNIPFICDWIFGVDCVTDDNALVGEFVGGYDRPPFDDIFWFCAGRIFAACDCRLFVG